MTCWFYSSVVTTSHATLLEGDCIHTNVECVVDWNAKCYRYTPIYWLCRAHM